MDSLCICFLHCSTVTACILRKNVIGCIFVQWLKCHCNRINRVPLKCLCNTVIHLCGNIIYKIILCNIIIACRREVISAVQCQKHCTVQHIRFGRCLIGTLLCHLLDQVVSANISCILTHCCHKQNDLRISQLRIFARDDSLILCLTLNSNRSCICQ